MKNTVRKIAAMMAGFALLLALPGCGTAEQTGGEGTVYKVGICSYVDDASLDQIVDYVECRLEEIGAERGVTFEILFDNCNGDAAVMNQIIAGFLVEDVDLMVGVATPVAMAMQAATEDTAVPVVFAAVSDPVGAGLVECVETPGGNLTGTSDHLDTDAVMDLIFAAHPDADLIGLLYDQGQDASSAPIAAAKAYLEGRGVAWVERTGTTNEEVMLASRALVADGVDAVFTPTDNTVMTAELAIYEIFIEGGIPHYAGADSFALNGAFLGYGVDYAALGTETANMAADILLNGGDPAVTPVKLLDNGIATVNTETCEALGLDFGEVEALFAPLCTRVAAIRTAERFDDPAG